MDRGLWYWVRSLHDPHRRGRERRVPAQGRDVQPRRLVRRPIRHLGEEQPMCRHVTLTLSALAALAAGVCAAPVAARAAKPLQNTIVINPSSGCGLLTAY